VRARLTLFLIEQHRDATLREFENMRAWEEYFETYPEPEVAGVWRRWKQNRRLFDWSEGLGMTDRTIELDLRSKTDDARDRLDAAEDAWEAKGFRRRGLAYGRWNRRRMNFFKALYAENLEYEDTLRHHGIDPEDDDAVESLIQHYISEA
jgi:hypothetical protein